MITARRSRWFEKLFRVYNRNLLARRFEGLRVAGMERLRERRRDAPLVLYANHSSWWDGLVAFEIGASCNLEQYVMMEERQLRAYPLFRRLGAFSVVREDARAAMRSVEYAAELLRDEERKAREGGALWLFPQGATRPNDARPFKFYSGAARIALRLDAVMLLPVAMRYEHLDGFRPEIFARIGEPELVGVKRNAKELTRMMEDKLTKTLDGVRADITGGNLADYVELVAPRRRAKAERDKAKRGRAGN